MFPLEFRGEINHEETSHGATLWWTLHDPNFNRFWLIHPYDRQTDRQTDGRAIAYTRYSIYAVARKNEFVGLHSGGSKLGTVQAPSFKENICN